MLNFAAGCLQRVHDMRVSGMVSPTAVPRREVLTQAEVLAFCSVAFPMLDKDEVTTEILQVRHPEAQNLKGCQKYSITIYVMDSSRLMNVSRTFHKNVDKQDMVLLLCWRSTAKDRKPQGGND